MKQTVLLIGTVAFVSMYDAKTPTDLPSLVLATTAVLALATALALSLYWSVKDKAEADNLYWQVRDLTERLFRPRGPRTFTLPKANPQPSPDSPRHPAKARYL